MSTEEVIIEDDTPFAPHGIGARRHGQWIIPPGLRRALFFHLHRPWAKIGHPIQLFEYMERTFGPISHYRFMGKHIVFINDPAYVQEILINQASSFVRERTLRRMKILLGDGLLTADDPQHMRSRRIAAPAFHRQRIAAYADQIVQITSSMRDRWQPSQTIDIAATMMHLSLEIVARTLFATEVTDDIRAINEQVNIIMQMYNYLVAFPNLEAVLHWPIPRVVRFRKAKEKLDAVVNRIIAERRAEGTGIKPQGSDHGDLLSMLLLARDEDGSALSDEQLRDEVLTIFLAGYETTANALTWTWYLLAQNPDAAAEMIKEIDTVLGVGSQARLPTLADYPNLSYTQMVFAESMRLYPPAWAMGRASTAPVQLGPYRLPPGTHFFFSQYILHRSPQLYSDPLRFDPMRHTEEEKSKRPRFAYFPFGGGGRQCIGESFAWMEGVLVLATIAQRWQMHILPNQQIDVEEKITLRPRYPIHMSLEPRDVS